MKLQEELSKELKSRDIRQADLCRRLGIHRSMLNEVLKGKRKLSIELALGLESYFIKTAKYWLSLQLDDLILEAKKSDSRFNCD